MREKISISKMALDNTRGDVWMFYIDAHKRSQRFAALHEIWDDVKRDRRRAELFVDVWTADENLWRTRDIWEPMLEELSEDVFRAAMIPSDREAMESFDFPLTVYRGGRAEYEQGNSWTISRNVAERFASRFVLAADREGEVYTKQVEREEVAFFHAGRGESEVVLWTGEV